VSRWTLYRDRRQRKRNASLLLMLSGAIRSADVELPYFERGANDGWIACSNLQGLETTGDVDWGEQCLG